MSKLKTGPVPDLILQRGKGLAKVRQQVQRQAALKAALQTTLATRRLVSNILGLTLGLLRALVRAALAILKTRLFRLLKQGARRLTWWTRRLTTRAIAHVIINGATRLNTHRQVGHRTLLAIRPRVKPHGRMQPNTLNGQANQGSQHHQ